MTQNGFLMGLARSHETTVGSGYVYYSPKLLV